MKNTDPTTAREAQALKTAYQARKKIDPSLNQEKLAEQLGFAGQSAVSQYFNGRISLNHSSLLKFCSALNVSPAEISPRLASDLSPFTGHAPTRLHDASFSSKTLREAVETTVHFELAPIEQWSDTTPLGPDEVALPFYKDVELSAGNGSALMQESSGRKLRFGERTLRNHNVNPAHAVAATVRGTSMQPVMPDGCCVAINTEEQTIIDGKVYAISHAGELRIKLLYRLPGGGVRIRSYNEAEYPDETYQADIATDIRIIGRVFWYSVML